MEQRHTQSAPIWRRVAALLYDTFILLALSFLYGTLVTACSVKLGQQPEDYQPMFSSPLFLIGWILCLMSFYCWFWYKSGQTLGMKTWRLKLIQDSPTILNPTWQQCLLRSLISPPMVMGFGVGYWYGYFDKNHDSLHDKLTRTRVVVIKKDT